MVDNLVGDLREYTSGVLGVAGISPMKSEDFLFVSLLLILQLIELKNDGLLVDAVVEPFDDDVDLNEEPRPLLVLLLVLLLLLLLIFTFSSDIFKFKSFAL